MFSLGHFLNVLLVGCAVFCLNKKRNLIQPLPSVMLDISFLIQYFCFIAMSVRSHISMSFSQQLLGKITHLRGTFLVIGMAKPLCRNLLCDLKYYDCKSNTKFEDFNFQLVQSLDNNLQHAIHEAWKNPGHSVSVSAFARNCCLYSSRSFRSVVTTGCSMFAKGSDNQIRSRLLVSCT